MLKAFFGSPCWKIPPPHPPKNVTSRKVVPRITIFSWNFRQSNQKQHLNWRSHLVRKLPTPIQLISFQKQQHSVRSVWNNTNYMQKLSAERKRAGRIFVGYRREKNNGKGSSWHKMCLEKTKKMYTFMKPPEIVVRQLNHRSIIFFC